MVAAFKPMMATQTNDGHDMDQILKALNEARRHGDENPDGKPVFILAHTVKGKGVSFMEDQIVWHGAAPKPEEAQKAIQEILSKKFNEGKKHV